MFVLLQIYPPEAADDDDQCCCLDVIAVDPSEAALERYLAAYEFRYRAACEDFDAWDNLAKHRGEEHERMHNELTDKYQVYGNLIPETKFKIVECWSSGRPFRDEEPEPVLPPMAHG